MTGKEVHPVDIYGVMIVENVIEHKDATCTLIHFLCVKRGYKGLSYANKLMRYAFSDRRLQNIEVYAVSRLPPPYSVRHEDLQYRIRDDHHYHDRKILPDSYFTSQKLTLDYKDTACRDLVLRDSKMLKLDPKKIANLRSVYDNESSTVYCVDNATRYSITYTTNNEYYAKNNIFGWSKLTESEKNQLPKTKWALAKKYKGQEVVLYDSGSRLSSEITNVNNLISNLKLPPDYYQSNYSVRNGCVWLSMCQLLYQVDQDQSQLLLQLYKANPHQFEYIRFFTKNNEATGSLDGLMCSSPQCQYRVVHCHPGKGNSLTDYILNQRLSGFFIVLLEDHMGGYHHTVGLDISSKLLFDPMEKSVLKLNCE